jgi:hypothetical protein
MRLYIFKKENEYDYERIPIEVLRVREKGMDIQKGNDIVTLRWDTEHTFPMLKCDDIVNIFIIGDNYEKGYVIEKFRNLHPEDIDTHLLFKSELDKITQELKNETEMGINILKDVLEHFSYNSMEIEKIFRKITQVFNDNQKDYANIKKTIEQEKNPQLKGMRGET